MIDLLLYGPISNLANTYIVILRQIVNYSLRDGLEA
jgi:hypothetical protein